VIKESNLHVCNEAVMAVAVGSTVSLIFMQQLATFDLIDNDLCAAPSG